MHDRSQQKPMQELKQGRLSVLRHSARDGNNLVRCTCVLSGAPSSAFDGKRSILALSNSPCDNFQTIKKVVNCRIVT